MAKGIQILYCWSCDVKNTNTKSIVCRIYQSYINYCETLIASLQIVAEVVLTLCTAKIHSWKMPQLLKIVSAANHSPIIMCNTVIYAMYSDYFWSNMFLYYICIFSATKYSVNQRSAIFWGYQVDRFWNRKMVT